MPINTELLYVVHLLPKVSADFTRNLHFLIDYDPSDDFSCSVSRNACFFLIKFIRTVSLNDLSDGSNMFFFNLITGYRDVIGVSRVS